MLARPDEWEDHLNVYVANAFYPRIALIRALQAHRLYTVHFRVRSTHRTRIPHDRAREGSH